MALADPVAGRPRRVIAALALVALGGLGIGLGLGLSGGAASEAVEKGPAARAVATVFREALALEQNLGAPIPTSASGSAWALSSDDLVSATRRLPAHLEQPEHPWTKSNGTITRLGTSGAAQVIATQRKDVDLVFAGTARRQVRAELSTLVAGEERSVGDLVSPGGARILRFYALDTDRGDAHVEALVVEWNQRDRVVGASGHEHIDATIDTDEVDASATLRRSAGRWRIVAFAAAPWQQPT